MSNAEITCLELKARLDEGAEVLLIDCREPDEHEMVRIEEAVLIPMSELLERFPEIAGRLDDEVVVHCHHGVRSLQVTAWLQQQGFSNVRSLRGGIDSWAVQVNPSLKRY